ncbi:hypothetical protein MRX96_042205 [Rhipicephalus microplus]
MRACVGVVSKPWSVPSLEPGHPGKATFLAAPGLPEGHLLLLTGRDSFLDVWRSGPADLCGPGRSALPWRPPDAGRRLVGVYNSFSCFALPAFCCMPGLVVTACSRRHRTPVTVVTAPPSSTAARPTLSLPGLAAARSCCPPAPADTDPTRSSSAKSRRLRQRHAPYPSGSAHRPSSAPSARDSGFPCTRPFIAGID